MHHLLPDTTNELAIVAYFTKGLGDVAAGEISDIGGAVDIDDEPSERFLTARLPARAVAGVRDYARMIDDLRLLVAGPETVDSIEAFGSLVERAGQRTRELLGADRRGDGPWSVTLSARRPLWRAKPRWDPAPLIRTHLSGADPTATGRRPVDIRIQVDGQTIHASLNLGSRPIGKSPVAITRPGALRPTVASALVKLALQQVDAPPDQLALYDPFCGTGTIVAAATELGIAVFASDVDSAAVEATRNRLAALAPGPSADANRDGQADQQADLLHRVFLHDVTAGVPNRGAVPLVVSNLPWGKQIRIERRSDLFDKTAAIAARALRAGGACALLTTNEDQLAARLRRQSPTTTISIRRIGLLGQTPAIVIVGPGGSRGSADRQLRR